jgi:exodeoxyribonuclease V alpha subunit
MLTKVLRQAEKSGILSDANKIRNGINPLEYISSRITTGELQDMFYMFRENNEALRDIAISTFMKTAKTDGVDSVEIITPRRNNSVTSVTEINNIIVHKLFPNAEYTIFADKAYCVGAKVMQLDNDYEDNVFNGEVGHIIKIEEKVFDGKFQKVITVKFLNSGTDAAGKIVDYKVSSLIHLDLAYAVTVHKKQGGSISTAICIIDMSSYIMLDSCLLYTAITRAKKRCLLLSQPQAFNRAIGINHNLSRQTWMSVMDNK